MKQGVLIISHGSQEPKWVELVDASIRKAAEELTIPVVSAFLEIVEGRLIQDGIDELERLGVTDMFVLPLFVSSGSTHVDEIGQALGFPPLTDFEGDLGVFRVNAGVTYGAPIDDDPEIAELLLENVRELSTDPSRETLLLLGHGSKLPVFHERWQEGLGALAERLRQLGGFARADYAMLLPDQAADKLRELSQWSENEVIVVPVFLSPGYFTTHVIPGRLEGMSYRYNGRAMLPHSAIERWMSRRIHDWLAAVNIG
ncbi:CbiX/SirB N-terminal domain-containing protein [Paenibacillus sp. PL2-23]|uniref:sirohydrochlorin chelatase n=1 Tax=Paenibacillus sp. PL2-23 TaxID=2100729 RepID=UPI0030F5C707